MGKVGFLKEKNPMWKGGISFEPYCPKFNDSFKEKVRKFFGRKCMICGKVEETCYEKLSVHHITYDKNICCNDKQPIFITCCRSCHTKTNNNREGWENNLFNYINIWFDGICWKN